MNTNIKRPFKLIEIPLSKFTEDVIPHHQNILEKYKVTVKKLVTVNDLEQLNKEITNKKRTVRQLKDLLYELDTLRAQVEDKDLDVFDTKTLSLRKIILKLISEYGDLEKLATKTINKTTQKYEVESEDRNPFEGSPQIKIQADLDELKLQQHLSRAERVEALENDIQDLHGIHVQLHQMVGEQSEYVENIEANVETTQENVNAGLRHLTKAHKLKAAAYPVTGAFLGTIVGGPVGFVAGFKVGALAAVGCGVAGYIAGKVTKKLNERVNTHSENHTIQTENAEEKTDGSPDKKDI